MWLNVFHINNFILYTCTIYKITDTKCRQFSHRLFLWNYSARNYWFAMNYMYWFNSSTEQTLPKVHLSHNIKLHTLQLPFIGEHLLALILLNSPLFDHCYISWTWTLGFIMNLAEIIHHEPVQLFIMSLTAVTKMCSLKKPEHNDSPWTHDNL